MLIADHGFIGGHNIVIFLDQQHTDAAQKEAARLPA